MVNLKPIDSVRASREGHEFHEAWTARKALQLLLPTDNLVGIAVEGLSPADQAAAVSMKMKHLPQGSVLCVQMNY